MDSKGKECYLRLVKPEDIDLLFSWANDPEVRKNAFHTEQIPYEEHKKWFAKLLQDESQVQYILMEGEEAIGQIRLSLSDNTALIGYSIVSDKRGCGYGKAMLKLVREKVCNEYPNIHTLIGQVKPGNQASAKCFSECGYMETYRQFELKCGE